MLNTAYTSLAWVLGGLLTWTSCLSQAAQAAPAEAEKTAAEDIVIPLAFSPMIRYAIVPERGHAAGYGLGIDYRLVDRLGLHAEGTVFQVDQKTSLFFPLTLRYFLIDSPASSSALGAGVFVSSYESQQQLGGLFEMNLDFKSPWTRQLGFTTGLDIGFTVFPYASLTVGLKGGIKFWL